MKKVNLYLLAFFSILGHSLIFGMTFPEMGVMIAILAKIHFDSRIEANLNKEAIELLKEEVKKLKDHVIRVDNYAKSYVGQRKNG